MKKILIGLAVIITFIIIAYKVSNAKAGNQTESGSEDLFDTGPNHDFRVGSDGSIYTTEGFPHSIEWNDIPTASTVAISGGNLMIISTTSLASGGTTYTPITTGSQFTQIGFPRNIVCQIDFTYGTSTSTANGTLTISGKNAIGNSDTEVILVSTGTTARPGKGVKAWAFIDSLAFSGFTVVVATQGVSDQKAHIHVGTGDKIGIGYDVLQATDVYKTTVDHVDYSTCSYKSLNGVSPTYDTLDTSKLGLNLIPNAARDYRIWLKTGITH